MPSNSSPCLARRPRRVAWLLLATCLAFILAGCTTNTIRRPHGLNPATPENRPQRDAPYSARLDAYAGMCKWSGNAGHSGDNRYRLDPACAGHSIEITDRYRLFFVEFDEQGRLYDDRQHEQLFADLKRRVACGRDLSIVVFVHGWRHNASADDSNVDLAREVLSYTYEGEQTEPHPNRYRNRAADKALVAGCDDQKSSAADPREVVGIYVGWRGKSMDGGKLFPWWELPSVWDRKNTAENVAVGSVRELFSQLRVFQRVVNENESECNPGAEPFLCKRVRMLIVGHSFGGLLVFNAVSPSIMDGLSQSAFVDPKDPKNCVETYRTGGDGSALVRSFADLIVLINPAVEGARFEPLHQAVQRRARLGAFCANQKPVLIVATAQNDFATRFAFRVVRAAKTIFESNSPNGVDQEDALMLSNVRHSEEVEASLNAMGHIERFQTHEMRGTELLARGDAADPRLEGLREYCRTSANDALEEALRDCRCGTLRWSGYMQRSAEQSRSNCPTYVEEVNSAQYLLAASAPRGAVASPTLDLGPDRRPFCGGPVIERRPDHHAVDGSGHAITDRDWARTVSAPNSPVWMIKTYDTSIIDNHSKIDHPPLKLFIRQAYHDISLQNYGPEGFETMERVATRNFSRECTDTSQAAR